MSQRDEIARIIDSAMGHPDDMSLNPVTELGEWNAETIADALRAAGLLVPPDSELRRLQKARETLIHFANVWLDGPGKHERGSMAWNFFDGVAHPPAASFLDTQETP